MHVPRRHTHQQPARHPSAVTPEGGARGMGLQWTERGHTDGQQDASTRDKGVPTRATSVCDGVCRPRSLLSVPHAHTTPTGSFVHAHACAGSARAHVHTQGGELREGVSGAQRKGGTTQPSLMYPGYGYPLGSFLPYDVRGLTRVHPSFRVSVCVCVCVCLCLCVYVCVQVLCV